MDTRDCYSVDCARYLFFDLVFIFSHLLVQYPHAKKYSQNRTSP
jgi:hypothetical protein